jgi:ATP-dependent Clp protease ATP-binding subunit ClpB
VQDPLAEKILAGDVRDGDLVKITAGSDRLLFVPSTTAAQAKAA